MKRTYKLVLEEISKAQAEHNKKPTDKTAANVKQLQNELRTISVEGANIHSGIDPESMIGIKRANVPNVHGFTGGFYEIRGTLVKNNVRTEVLAVGEDKEEAINNWNNKTFVLPKSK